VRILAVSDIVDERLYSEQVLKHHKDVQIILGCGDLPYEYLEFLVSVLNIPLLYVPGNHDPAYDVKNPKSLAEGCENIDGKLLHIKGLYIAGLGGSIRYQPHRPNQYSQFQMKLKVIQFIAKKGPQHVRNGNKLDIFISHSPPFGLNDDDDPAHVGFSAFNTLIEKLKPRYFLHGHVTAYKGNLVPREIQSGATKVINIYPYKVLDIN
jgi:uncharacterized protein